MLINEGGINDSKYTVFKLSQFLKAPSSIFFSDFGNVIEANAVQYANDSFPRETIDFPKVTDDRFLQLSNAPSPIVVTLFPISTRLIAKLSKAYFPIDSTEFGITNVPDRP